MRIEPMKKMTAKITEISVCPTPKRIPARFPYLMENFKASSNYLPYF
jgi:hypothetical protein